MARIAEELKAKAIALGIEGSHTSWWHLFGWDTFGVLLFGPAVATHRFFDTLNKVERRLDDSDTLIGFTIVYPRETIIGSGISPCVRNCGAKVTDSKSFLS